MQKPRPARTLLGACLGLTLTWLSACNNTPTDNPMPNPATQEQDDLESDHLESDQEEPSSSKVALTKELIEALKVPEKNKDKNMAQDLQTLQQALQDIQEGKRKINELILFPRPLSSKKRHVLEAVLMFGIYEDLLQALIQQGADVNDKHGKETLLTRATSSLSYQAIKWLLAKEANVQEADQGKLLVSNISQNPQLSAEEKQSLSETLVEKGATKEKKNIFSNFFKSNKSKGTTNDSKEG